MATFVILYIIGSFAATPFLAFHLLRTRRELNALRDEVRARGLGALAREEARGDLAPPRDAALPHGQDPDVAASAIGSRLDALAAAVERIAAEQRALVRAGEDAAGPSPVDPVPRPPDAPHAPDAAR